LAVGLGADQDAAGGSEALEPGARVDRVADERVRDVAVASDLAQHGLTAVDADAESRPAGMLIGDRAERLLQRECRARRAESVVGLVAATVERRGDAVPDELLELAAEPPRDQRRRDAPVRVEHR